MRRVPSAAVPLPERLWREAGAFPPGRRRRNGNLREVGRWPARGRSGGGTSEEPGERPAVDGRHPVAAAPRVRNVRRTIEDRDRTYEASSPSACRQSALEWQLLNSRQCPCGPRRCDVHQATSRRRPLFISTDRACSPSPRDGRTPARRGVNSHGEPRLGDQAAGGGRGRYSPPSCISVGSSLWSSSSSSSNGLPLSAGSSVSTWGCCASSCSATSVLGSRVANGPSPFACRDTEAPAVKDERSRERPTALRPARNRMGWRAGGRASP